MRHRAICLVLLLWCFAPLARAAEPADAAAQNLFCWKVAGPQGTVYLFGTIHVGKADFYPLPEAIESSFRKADALVTETDLTEPQSASRLLKLVMQQAAYPVGDSVENHITAPTRALLQPYVAKRKELEADYLRLKPWFLSVSIAVIEAKRLGLDASQGLDRHFVDEATAMHKSIDTLETTEFQLQLLSSFSEALQDRLLLSALLEAEHMTELMDRMVQAWRTGDADAMEETKTLYVHDYPALKAVFEQMFDQRNDRMTQEIEHFLHTPKTYFVAVGAGHLTGERGILSQLRAKHYTVEQLHDGAMQRADGSDHRPN